MFDCLGLLESFPGFGLSEFVVVWRKKIDSLRIGKGFPKKSVLPVLFFFTCGKLFVKKNPHHLWEAVFL